VMSLLDSSFYDQCKKTNLRAKFESPIMMPLKK